MQKITQVLQYGLMAVLAFILAGCGDKATVDALQTRVDALEGQLQKVDDIQAIEKLTRAYGYYVDKQIWTEIVPLFSSDARVEIAGRGVYRNTKGVTDLFLNSMGGGSNGLRDGTIFNHMLLQGVTDINPDGETATGRWRAWVQIGGHQQFALWSEGTYRNQYKKVDGVWQISDMHFYATFYAPYEQGWHKGPLPNNGPSKSFPPDEPPSVEYDVFPGHYVPPFDYPNPVTGREWTIEDTNQYSTKGMSPQRNAPTAAEQTGDN